MPSLMGSYVFCMKDIQEHLDVERHSSHPFLDFDCKPSKHNAVSVIIVRFPLLFIHIPSVLPSEVITHSMILEMKLKAP